MHQWFDTGVNLFSDRFAQDRDAVVERARQNQVDHLLLISSDLAESYENINYCQTNTHIYCTAGVHPHQASAVTNGWIEELKLLLQKCHVVAVGECGLDFNRNFSAPEQQIKVFEAQLELAQACGKAVYLHERDAFSTQLSLLKSYPGLTGVAHCFTGSLTELKAYLDLGLYIGITGWLCDEKRGQDLREAIRYLPLDRLILETDAPFLLPKTIRPKPKSGRNEPAYITEIAVQFAALTGHSLNDIALYSRRNSLQLFQLQADGQTL